MLTISMKEIIENVNSQFKKYYALTVLNAFQRDYLSKKNNTDILQVINKQYTENLKMLMFLESLYCDRERNKVLPELRMQAVTMAKNNYEIWLKNFQEVYKMSAKEKDDLLTILTVLLAIAGMVIEVQGGEKNEKIL